MMKSMIFIIKTSVTLSTDMSDEVPGQQFVQQLPVLRRHGRHAGRPSRHGGGRAGGRQLHSAVLIMIMIMVIIMINDNDT